MFIKVGGYVRIRAERGEARSSELKSSEIPNLDEAWKSRMASSCVFRGS